MNNRIKELRLSHRLTQNDLALRMGVTPQAVSNYELGTRVMDALVVGQLCDIFDCSADYLLCRSERPPEEITAEEYRIVVSYRRADERTRALVDLALEPFDEKKAASAG